MCVKKSKSLSQLSANVRKLREDLRLTQDELERRSGLGVNQICRIERGYTEPKWYTLEKIAIALGVNIEDLTRGC